MLPKWLIPFLFCSIVLLTRTHSAEIEVDDDLEAGLFPIEEDVEFELPESISKREAVHPEPAPSQQQRYGNGGYSKCAAPEGLPGTCKPLATCSQYYSTPAHYHYEKQDYYKSCTYGYGSRGVCCPDIYYSGYKAPVIQYNPQRYYGYDGKYHGVPKEGIIKAIQYAQDYIHKVYDDDRGLGRNEDHPSYWGNGIAQEHYVNQPSAYGDTGYFFTKVTEYLQKEYGYKPESFYDGGLQLVEYSQYLPEKYSQICRSYYKKCYPSKYRSIDGSCNNLKHSYYGASWTILGRVAIPRYGDKVHEVRRSVEGYALPLVRKLRYTALPDKNVEEKSVNMMFSNYGQFITHDLVHTPFYQANDGLFLDCCQGYKGGEGQVHPKCYALSIHGDPFYSRTTRETCLNFARAIVAPNYGCTAGYANPLNLQTSHMDLSLQYGIGYNDSHNLRVHKDGLLKMSRVGDQYYLPLDSKAECFNSSKGFCFASGDFRTTIHPGITLVQIISTRFHNLVAKKLAYLNPYWDDEKLYQEARRINIAVNQHIVYTEFLPLLLGWKFMYEHGILPPTSGYSYDYDEHAKPWIYAEFSGAAFRLHTGVYGNIVLANEYYQPEKELPLQNYYNSAILYRNPHNFEKLLRGYIYASKRRHDKYYDPALTNYLLKDERHFGLDLASFNIHRGRDYGLNSYNDYREMCGLPRAKQWSDFHDWIDKETVDHFRTTYRHPDDVDLYAGGVAEKHFPDSLLGPTWWCIVGFQFQRLKLSDRYFYTLGNQHHSFTQAQLDEIRKMSMASLLCMTTGLKQVPAFALRTISSGNPLVSCSDYEYIPRMNFGPWKSYPGHNEL